MMRLQSLRREMWTGPLTFAALLLASAQWAPAQTVETSVPELLNGLKSSHTYDRSLRMICEKAERGDDISQAVPTLKQVLRQNIDPRRTLGVTPDANDVLRALMRTGDAESVNFFLAAQDRYFQTTGKAWIDSYSSYLEVIDQSDQWDAYPVIARQYPHVDSNRKFSMLYHLARFAPDKRVIVRELNRLYAEDHNAFSNGRALGATVYVADQPDVLTQLLRKYKQPFSDELLKNGNHDQFKIIAALAPFHSDAMTLFTRALNLNQEPSHFSIGSIAAYVDSASRLDSVRREQAFARLRAVAAEVYDAQKPLRTIGYGPVHRRKIGDSPVFIEQDQLKPAIAAAFKDSGPLDVQQVVESLDVSTGLGTGF